MAWYVDKNFITLAVLPSENYMILFTFVALITVDTVGPLPEAWKNILIPIQILKRKNLSKGLKKCLTHTVIASLM